MDDTQFNNDAVWKQQQGVYGGGQPTDPHVACLRTGKRKKGGVVRCQVDGCEAVLVSAKEYHKRHKVCEVHAKAPKVVVFGLDHRFCQQCSRFHLLSEFDEWKRSCRRRLAGHNERRRKISTSYSHLPLLITSSTLQDDDRKMSVNEGDGRGHSLLSSPADHHLDLSWRSSAALQELIAENRASTILRRHWDSTTSCFYQDTAHVTLDLMHVPTEEPTATAQPQLHHPSNLLQPNNHIYHLF